MNCFSQRSHSLRACRGWDFCSIKKANLSRKHFFSFHVCQHVLLAHVDSYWLCIAKQDKRQIHHAWQNHYPKLVNIDFKHGWVIRTEQRNRDTWATCNNTSLYIISIINDPDTRMIKNCSLSPPLIRFKWFQDLPTPQHTLNPLLHMYWWFTWVLLI